MILPFVQRLSKGLPWQAAPVRPGMSHGPAAGEPGPGTSLGAMLKGHQAVYERFIPR